MLLRVKPDKLVVSHIEEFTKLYRYRLSKQTVDDFTSRSSKEVDDQLLAAYDRSRNLQVDWSDLVLKDRHLRLHRAAIATFIHRYEEWKQKNGYLDFLDLLVKGFNESVSPPVELAVIDEFQDSSPLMASQIALWAERIPNVIIAGDPNQALYEFMGTNPKIFRNFHASETVMLTQSHRVPDNNVKLALRIINKNKGEEAFHFNGNGTKGSTVEVPSLAHVIEGIRTNKDKSFLLMARDNYNLGLGRDFLRKQGIPVGASAVKTAAVKLVLSRPATITRYDLEILISELFPSKRSRLSTGAWERGAKTRLEVEIEKGFSPCSVSDLAKFGADASLVHALTTGDLTILKMTGDELRYYRNIVEKWDGRHDLVRAFTFHGAKGREADISIIITDVTKRIHEEETVGDTESERRCWYVAVTRAKLMNILVRRTGAYSTRIL